MKMNIVTPKSKQFAIRIIKLYKHLTEVKHETIMSKQLLRCGTSIGANLFESEHAQSESDFLHKNNIALKEANETKYWLELLRETEYITEKQFDSLMLDCLEINRLLAASIKTLKEKTNK
ncbi:MAG: four helix bundle protein [Bacillota bacterium]